MRGAIVGLVLAGCTPEVTLVPGEAWETELARLDDTVAALEEAQASSPDWTRSATLAGLLRLRVRLSGEWEDYDRAAAHLDHGFAIAPPQSGPFAARADLLLGLHRYDEAADALVAAASRPLLGDGELAGLLVAEAVRRMSVDDHVAAEDFLLSAIRLDDGMGAWATLGRLRWLTGDFAGAEIAYDAAEARYHGSSAEPLAWLHLQRGLMDLDRGRHAEALDHYLDADDALPGYWLVHEHVAEVLVLLGNREDAHALYADVVERTGLPDLADTWADLLAADGRIAEAHDLRAAAARVWEERLAVWPEAAYGHAVGHYMVTDPARAVVLAEADVANRPGAVSRTALASAYLAAGDPVGAREPIDRALESAWRSAETFAVGAQVYAALGDPIRSADLCDAARAIDPTSSCRPVPPPTAPR